MTFLSRLPCSTPRCVRARTYTVHYAHPLRHVSVLIHARDLNILSQVGYAQGMNDILSMILAVIDHEADAYWCFKFYMLSVQEDFQMQGMMDHIGTHARTLPLDFSLPFSNLCLLGSTRMFVCSYARICLTAYVSGHDLKCCVFGTAERLKDLHQKMDPVLHKHFDSCDAGDMVFAHRCVTLSARNHACARKYVMSVC